jgi:hypothetical protein
MVGLSARWRWYSRIGKLNRKGDSTRLTEYTVETHAAQNRESVERRQRGDDRGSVLTQLALHMTSGRPKCAICLVQITTNGAVVSVHVD